MAQTPEQIDYLKFLKWFQDKYPDEYVFYCQHVTMSKNGTVLTEDGGSTTKEEKSG
jgi:hypothetical protein